MGIVEQEVRPMNYIRDAAGQGYLIKELLKKSSGMLYFKGFRFL